jgi:hypothetical protein
MSTAQIGRDLPADRKFPIGQRIMLTGHFPEPVVLEAVIKIVFCAPCSLTLRTDRLRTGLKWRLKLLTLFVVSATAQRCSAL